MNLPDCLAATGPDSAVPVLVGILALILMASGAAAVITARRRSSAGRLSAVLVLTMLAGGLVLTSAVASAAPAVAASDCAETPSPQPSIAPTSTPAPTPTPTPSPTLVEEPSMYQGSWTGQVPFPGSDIVYQVDATISDDGSVASAVVGYPGLCTATWTQVSRDDQSITMLETLDQPYDPANCVDGGTITLTPSGDPLGTTLDWYYVYSTGPGPFDQSTTLTRIP